MAEQYDNAINFRPLIGGCITKMDANWNYGNLQGPEKD